VYTRCTFAKFLSLFFQKLNRLQKEVLKPVSVPLIHLAESWPGKSSVQVRDPWSEFPAISFSITTLSPKETKKQSFENMAFLGHALQVYPGRRISHSSVQSSPYSTPHSVIQGAFIEPPTVCQALCWVPGAQWGTPAMQSGAAVVKQVIKSMM